MAIIIILTLCIGLTLGFLLGRSVFLHRNIGEALVANTINAGFHRPHLLLNNVTLKDEENTTQIDHILVADTGIFVIETKHYTGWIFGHPKDTQWTQVIYKRKTRFQNPIRQNYGHVQALQALFNLPTGAFHSVVVFTNDAEFKTELGPTVLKLSQLIGHLLAERPVLFDERRMAYIIGRIEMKRMQRSTETDEYHLNSIRQRTSARQRQHYW